MKQKLKALKNHLLKTAGISVTNQWLNQNIDNYVFTDDGIFHINELPEQVKDSVDFEIDNSEKVESIKEFKKIYPDFNIVKSRYFDDKKRWLILGYFNNQDVLERYYCFAWYDSYANKLADSTYYKSLMTYEIIEKDLEYVSKPITINSPDLSEYYGTFYTRKQLSLLEV